MLKVWGRKNSINVQKVMWTIGELGLAHERVDVGGPFGGLDTDDYAARNANRRVPTLEDGGLTIWESNVIVRYLAAKADPGGLWPEDPAARAVADQWMDWQQTTLLPDLTTVFFNLVRFSPEQRDMAAVAAAAAKLGKIWPVLDRQLDGRTYVAGENFTMGDIPVGAAYYRYKMLEIERPDFPNIEPWYERLKERPAFVEHVTMPLT